MDFGFGKPVENGMTVVGGGWGAGPGGKHAGLDIRLPVGTPIMSIGDGVVTSMSATPRGDLGIFVAVTHPSGVVSRYLHLSDVAVALGERVSRGEILGLSGNTGNSAGPHLHLDLKVANPLVVQQVRDEVGEPPGGFESNVTGFGVGIPAEPWVPVDAYEPTVTASALANGIPLYRPRGVSDLVASTGKYGPILLLGAAGTLFYLLWRR